MIFFILIQTGGGKKYSRREKEIFRPAANVEITR